MIIHTSLPEIKGGSIVDAEHVLDTDARSNIRLGTLYRSGYGEGFVYVRRPGNLAGNLAGYRVGFIWLGDEPV